MQVLDTGYIETLTTQEREVMLKVRHFIHNELNITDKRWNNWAILRYCRARKFNYDEIVKMLNKHFEWFAEQKVADLGQVDMAKYARLREIYVHGYFNTDKKGRPIYIERTKDMNITACFNEYTEHELVNYHVQSYERLINVIMPSCSKAAGRRIEQTLTIMDLNGVNAFKLFVGKTKAFVKLAADVAQDHYPEILGNMYIVNSGYLFSGLWALVKPWIDPKTQKKIIIKSGSGTKELLELVDEEKLPEFLGGTCKDDLKADAGVFKEALELSKKNKTLFHNDQKLVDQYYLMEEEKEAKKDNKDN